MSKLSRVDQEHDDLVTLAHYLHWQAFNGSPMSEPYLTRAERRVIKSIRAEIRVQYSHGPQGD